MQQSATKVPNYNDVKVLDATPANLQNTSATKTGGPAANFGMVTGGIVAPDKPPIPTTPSKPPSNFRASYGTGNKKNPNVRKINTSSFHTGGHIGSKVVTRAQRPSSKRMIDHSQPPAVKTHRTDRTDPEKISDTVSIVN